METTNVLVVDDNAQFRRGLRALLSSVSDLDLVGEASSGQEAVMLAERLQPDVILMDISMPGLNGLEATRRILRDSPHMGVLMLTMLEDDDSVFEAMQAGARGYLLKGALKAEIVRAIRAVAGGDAIFGPAIARRLVQFFAAPHLHGDDAVFPELTQRERDILRLVAEQRTNPEIAARLGLASETVRNHVSNIFTKLQVATRAEAIIRARGAGLGSPPRRERRGDGTVACRSGGVAGEGFEPS